MSEEYFALKILVIECIQNDETSINFFNASYPFIKVTNDDSGVGFLSFNIPKLINE
jgi:hypothetical protein